MVRNILYYQNRIALLEGRTNCDNGNVIRKLKRKIKNLQKLGMY